MKNSKSKLEHRLLHKIQMDKFKPCLTKHLLNVFKF